jgi:hypothetical protein
MIDLSDWLTKQEAADRIGVSTKAIERFTRAGKLEQRFRPQAGSPHVAVYFPADVATLAQARQRAPVPFVLEASSDVPANGNGHHAVRALDRVTASVTSGDDLLSPGDNLLRVLVAAAARVMSETSQTPSLFLTIPEASRVSGLSQAYLKRRIAAGTLPAERDRGWRIRRKDLEAL